MDRKQMEEIARKRAPKRPTNLIIDNSNKGTTGQDALMLILGSEEHEEKPEPKKQNLILYLRNGVNPADSNFTKYPNDLHTIMLERLSKEYEGVLYVYLWRESFGYGKNYCRTSYLEILKNTLISSRKTAQRAISSLVEKHFIVRAKSDNGIPNINQQGALYRIFTPKEIQSRIAEEGIFLADLPLCGVVCQTIPCETTLGNASNNKVLQGMVSQGMDYETTGQTDHTLSDHTSIVRQTIPTQTIPKENTDRYKSNGKYGQTDHTHTDHPFKDNKDSLKDSLSQDQIIDLFYKGIGQEKTSKQKRERAEIDIKKLLEEGFALEDIHFAVKWTLENAKEKPYDFSIINHTIGQAMAEKGKAEKKEIKNLERERILAQKQAEDEKQEKLLEKVREYKNNLDDNQRKQLREEALKTIRNTKGIKEEFITEILIEAKENEIIKAKLGIDSLEN